MRFLIFSSFFFITSAATAAPVAPPISDVPAALRLAAQIAVVGTGPSKSAPPAPEDYADFVRDPSEDSARIRDKILRPGSKGLHAFLRRSPASFHNRMATLLKDAKVPTVQLHGDAHVEQYVKNNLGGGLTDFDETRDGPYPVDVIRFLISLSIQSESHTANRDGELLPQDILAAFREHYIAGLQDPDQTPPIPSSVADQAPKPKERSMRAYLDGNGYMAEKMREQPRKNDHPYIAGLMQQYHRHFADESVNIHEIPRDQYATFFKVKEAGSAKPLGIGSADRLKFLLILEGPTGSPDDDVMIEFKEVPENAAGVRRANDIYGANERLQAGITYQNRQFWAHKILPQYMEVEIDSMKTAKELGAAVAQQLGSGVGRQMPTAKSRQLADQFHHDFPKWVQMAAQVKREIEAAHREYIKAARDGS